MGRWTWHEPAPPAPLQPPAMEAHPSSKDLGLTRVWSPALSLNHCHPPCGPWAGQARPAALLGSASRACLCLPPWPTPRPGPQTTSLPDSPTLLLFCSPSSAAWSSLSSPLSCRSAPPGSLPGLGRNRSMARSPHGGRNTPGGWWKCRCSGSRSTRSQGSTRTLQLETQ